MAFKTVDSNNIRDFKNFTLNEFKCKCGGKYCSGFPVGFSYELASQLQNIRNHFGRAVIITSAVRCNQHNKNVGGVAKSKHKEGRAVDFYVKGVSYNTLKNYVSSLPHKNYYYNISGSVMHYDINPPEYVEKYNLTRLLTTKKSKGKWVCGSKGNDVKELQKELQRRGYNIGKDGIDGKFGNDTRNAVIKFQKDNRLSTDGKVGKNTAHALGWTYKGK